MKSLLLVLLLAWVAATDNFTMKLSGFFFHRGDSIRVTLHIPYREQNRRIIYQWEGEAGDGGSSEIDLVEGDHVTRQVTFERWIKNLNEGAHVVVSVLKATDGDMGPLKSEFSVQ